MMSMGEWIKNARVAAGLSLRQVADKAGVSHTAIAKYEKRRDIPSSGVLIRLSETLDVKVSYFLRRDPIRLSPPSYRKRSSLGAKQERSIHARVKDWLERYVEVESLFREPLSFDLPRGLPKEIKAPEETEETALTLRRAWNLGEDPIVSLVEILEDKNIKVGLSEGPDRFEAVQFLANDRVPVMVVNPSFPGDRQRLTLAHELGRVMIHPESQVDLEKACFRFAGAFLVPASAARFEVGNRRRNVSPHELHALKHKYGLSMQGWIYRMRDLGIISATFAKSIFQDFRRRGWHKKEPGDSIPPEKPQRMTRLICRALAEGLISESKAHELSGNNIDCSDITGLDKDEEFFWQAQTAQRFQFVR